MNVERSLWSQTRVALTALNSFKAISDAPTCLYQDEIAVFNVADEHHRLFLWASNIGALQGPSKRSSLDQRLNEAPQVRRQIARLLNRLSEAADRATSICKGTIPNREEDISESDYEDAIEQHGIDGIAPVRIIEVEELCRTISGLVTRLFRLSMAIRNPTPRDRYAKLATIKETDCFYDIAHVREKFPITNQAIWLAERLGKANSQRRDYFRYRRKHKEKLAYEEEVEEQTRRSKMTQEAEEHGFQGFAKASSSHPAVSSLGSTKASTYVQPDEAGVDLADDAASDTGVSETSFATSVEELSSSFLRVPPPPIDLDSAIPFICPYCFLVQAPTTMRAWKRHVYNDLQPYICTSEACSVRPFANRHAWFDHELQMHRREWLCGLCNHQPFRSATSFATHVKQSHTGEVTVKQLGAMIDMSSEPLDQFDPADCPLCDEWGQTIRSREVLANAGTNTAGIVVTPEQFRKHLGRHLEHLALFSLPRNSGGDDGGGGDSNEAVMDASSAEQSVSERSDDDSMVSEHDEEEIFRCIENESIHDLEVILASGANANVFNKHHATALWTATKANVLMMVLLLLDHGADCNIANADLVGETPLHAAIELNLLTMVELLLERGADPNAKTSDGYTALHLAIGNGTDDCVRLLCNGGADINATAEHGITPLQLAKNIGLDGTAQYLRNLGARETRPLKAGEADVDGVRLRTVIKLQRRFRMRPYRDRLPLHPRTIPIRTIRSFEDAAGLVLRYVQEYRSQQMSLTVKIEDLTFEDLIQALNNSLALPYDGLEGLVDRLYDYLISRYDKQASGVIPQIMQAFYEDFKVYNEIYLWSSIFDKSLTNITELYKYLGCQHRPLLFRSLNPRGLCTWMITMLRLNPEAEKTRLALILDALHPEASNIAKRDFLDPIVQEYDQPDENLRSTFDNILFKCSYLQPQARARRPAVAQLSD